MFNASPVRATCPAMPVPMGMSRMAQAIVSTLRAKRVAYCRRAIGAGPAVGFRCPSSSTRRKRDDLVVIDA
jgi:hypothetical protein